MVLMKNAAKARAPRSVCCVASSGMTGGFSPGRVFGPVVGTLRGTVGWLGCGGPGLLIVIGGGVDFGIGARLGQRRGVEQRIEDQRKAWQDRFLDPLERLVEHMLAIGAGHGAHAMGGGLTDRKLHDFR